MVNHGQRVAHLQEVAEIHVEPPEVVEAPAQAGLFFLLHRTIAAEKDVFLMFKIV